MRAFVVQGIAWQKEILVDDSLFDDYEAMGFEAMTQAITHFLNDDYEITDHDNFPTFPWFLVAFESGHEGAPDKTVVCLSEIVITNAGLYKISGEFEDFRRSVQRQQEADQR